MLVFFAVLALIAVAALVLWYRKERLADGMNEIVSRHRQTAKISSLADFVEGRNHFPVTLTLEEREIFYENADLKDSLEIALIDEVEYDTELAAGNRIGAGTVLRLRAHGRAVEFVLDPASAAKWSALLPPHRMGEAGIVRAV